MILYRYLIFILSGYLLGSILFAPIFGRIIKNKNILENSKDNNPGTANAFMQGGFLCGVLTLICDLAKGFIPVFLGTKYVYSGTPSELGFALLIAAPVAGHVFPLFSRFQGGKGIATTFGVLLGLVPDIDAAVVLAFFFILFSLVIRITAHFYRTIATYVFSAIVLFIWGERLSIKIAFFLITSLVCTRMHMSSEKREEMKVRLLWTH